MEKKVEEILKDIQRFALSVGSTIQNFDPETGDLPALRESIDIAIEKLYTLKEAFWNVTLLDEDAGD